VSLQQISFRGFANPVDPTPAELRAWAYNPDSMTLQHMPQDWDLLVANDRVVGTLLDLALDVNCPARRFALHCLYIFAADAIRTKFRAHSRRRLRKLVEQAESDGDEVNVTVIDSGAGISSAHLAKLEAAFFSTKPDGTGLGLPIARQIVAAHGGSLSVESREGCGTTVRVRLPLGTKRSRDPNDSFPEPTAAG